jgi:hypothetical protein
MKPPDLLQNARFTNASTDMELSKEGNAYETTCVNGAGSAIACPPHRQIDSVVLGFLLIMTLRSDR